MQLALTQSRAAPLTLACRAFHANGKAPLDGCSPSLGYDVQLISRHLRCDLAAPNVFNRGSVGSYYGGMRTCAPAASHNYTF